MKNGVTGKLYRCIRSMYKTVKVRVRKRGDVYSPVLFSLFINELALEIINNGNMG